MNFKYVAVGILCVFAGTYSCFGSVADDVRFGSSYYGQYNAMMNPYMMGLGIDKNTGFVESVQTGVKNGLAYSIIDSMRKSFDSTLGVNKIAALGGTIKKMVMARLHDNKGLDVRELFGWKWMLDASIATHVSNAAKGARVLRAKVLDQQVAETDVKPDALYGIGVVKKDMAYIVERLMEKRAHYQDAAIKTSARNWRTKILDVAAGAGMGYVIIDSLMPTLHEKDIAARTRFWIDESRHCNAHDARALAHVASGMSIEMRSGSDAINRYYQVTQQIIGVCAEQLEQSQQIGGITKTVAKSALALFALWRLVAWMRSDSAVRAADALCDVNRALIVHLIDSVRGNLQHLIVLCDSIKQESDIARYKDDFEFVSKNCSETLTYIAYWIDQNETLDIQRKGKPGQTTAAFGQGYAGLGAGLPKF